MLFSLIRKKNLNATSLPVAGKTADQKKRGQRVQKVHRNNYMTWNTFKVAAAVFTCALKYICIANFCWFVACWAPEFIKWSLTYCVFQKLHFSTFCRFYSPACQEWGRNAKLEHFILQNVVGYINVWKMLLKLYQVLQNNRELQQYLMSLFLTPSGSLGTGRGEVANSGWKPLMFLGRGRA